MITRFAAENYMWKPKMCKFYYADLTILVFCSLKIRIFDKYPSSNITYIIPIVTEWLSTLPIPHLLIKHIRLANSTCTCKLNCSINLYKLSQNIPLDTFIYEPEIISYMRLTRFNPLAVHLFASGSLVVMGGAHRDLVHFIETVITPYIQSLINKQNVSTIQNNHDSQSTETTLPHHLAYSSP